MSFSEVFYVFVFFRVRELDRTRRCQGRRHQALGGWQRARCRYFGVYRSTRNEGKKARRRERPKEEKEKKNLRFGV